MNSLANLNSVVEEQGDSAPWPSDQTWDPPPPATMICTGSLSDTRLHFQHSAPPRQEWDWSEGQMILAPHYVTEDDDLGSKPAGSMHVDSMAGGLRHYAGGGLMSAMSSMMVTSSVVGSSQTTWPGLLNAVPLRQAGGLESGGGSCFPAAPLMSMYAGGVGNAAGGNNQASLGSYYNQASQSQVMEMDQQRRLQDILKRGLQYTGAGDLGSARLGLNLGGRTYFSSEDLGARFHFPGMGKRFRPNSPNIHVPLCQAEGCKADLSIAKHYHRRHKVCEYHSKAATVMISGNTQRFCQQCSRFHALTEFDEGKRSCRKRLADHNRRRRKPQPSPAGPAGESNSQAASISMENNASKQEDQSKAAISYPNRTQSDHQGLHQLKEDMPKVNKNPSSSPNEQHATQLLSPMSLAPSVSLTLQNGRGRSEIQGNHSNSLSVVSQDKSNEEEAKFINEGHSLPPYLLNGPSLSLSSNNVANVRLRGMGEGDTIPSSSNQQSPAHMSAQPPAVDEVELSVPWLRGHHGSSSRVGSHVKDRVGKSSADDGSLLYKISSTSSASPRRNLRGDYLNEHDQLLAENMQNLHPQVRERIAQDRASASKMENWMLEGAVAHEGQTVLSLLENSACRNKEPQDYHLHSSAPILPLAEHHHHHQHHHQVEEDHRSGGARHPLDFLQQNQHQHSADMDHQDSDAALSLHCMQVLRPLSESLYTTADFMKDGFV